MTSQSARADVPIDRAGPYVRPPIGEYLRQAGVVTEAGLHEALEEQGRSGGRLGSVLVRLTLATERHIAEALARQLGLQYINLSEQPPAATAVVRIPKDVALKRTCVAVAVEKNVLTVAMTDPLLFALVQDLEFQTGCRVRQAVATREDIVEAIGRGYPDKPLTLVASTRTAAEGDGSGTPADRSRLDLEPATGRFGTGRPGEGVFEAADADGAASEATPIVEMVDLMIKGALGSGASDIHLEPADGRVVVRYRLDGLLKEAMDLPAWLHEGLVARLKIMAGLDIAEKRLPQDGRIRASTDEGRSIDLRVSTLRTILGEKVVLRVLDHGKGVPPLETLGLSAGALDHVRLFLRRQHGMLLVVGPTGSGKTTTLCAALAAVRSERSNIVTIEDPVEYQMPGVNQTQTNGRINLTFASSLRAILRQDPDIVLVGEIRDEETARIAMQAAQTGHLVLSTLHTDDAPSCVARLTDIGIEPYVSASALIGVIAQRLVRRLCTFCRVPCTPEEETLRDLCITEAEAASSTFYRAAGCHRCNGTGYKGRVGIYEIMPVGDALRRLIARKGAHAQLRDAALAAGMVSLAEDGLLKVKAGVTTPEELLRTVTEVRVAKGVCSACGGSLARDFAACPACGQRAGDSCRHCGHATQPDWKFCPYCAVGVHAPGTRASRRVSGLRAAR